MNEVYYIHIDEVYNCLCRGKNRLYQNRSFNNENVQISKKYQKNNIKYD